MLHSVPDRPRRGRRPFLALAAAALAAVALTAGGVSTASATPADSATTADSTTATDSAATVAPAAPAGSAAPGPEPAPDSATPGYAEVNVTVRGSNGTPIPGGSLDIRDSTGTYLSILDLSRQGTATIFLPVPGSAISGTIRINPPSNSPFLQKSFPHTFTGNTSSSLTLTLDEGGTISGAVKTRAGTSITSGSVSVVAYKQTTGGDWQYDRSGSSTGGTYSIPGLTPGAYRIGFSDYSSGPTVYADQWFDESDTAAGAKTITIGTGTKATADAALKRAGSISGQVTAAVPGGGSRPLGSDELVVVSLYEAATGRVTYSAVTTGAYEFKATPGLGYKVGFSSYSSGSSTTTFVPEYFDDEPTLAAASVLTAASGRTTTANAVLAKPGPALSTTRIAGADRYATAIEISKAGFPGTAPIVYVATGTNYPDALSAAAVAVKKGGPLLLTQPDSLPPSVAAEIKRLKPASIVIVGGTAAIAPAVETALKKLGTVTRIAGADRYETSRALVSSAFPRASNVYVATGANYPDALSASAAGGAFGAPIVLVNGGGTSVDAPTTSLLTALEPAKLTIAGGTSAVSSGIEAALKKVAPVTRIAGTDRYDTSNKLNAAAFGSASTVYLATGVQFPDALAGSALAGAAKAPLFVVQPNCVPQQSLQSITTLGATSAVLLGGPNALSASVAELASCGQR